MEIRYITTPIKNPPSRFANKTPAKNVENSELNAVPNNQRLMAPRAAPADMAMMVLIKFFTW
mgnify:CR=1 FL=1